MLSLSLFATMRASMSVRMSILIVAMCVCVIETPRGTSTPRGIYIRDSYPAI